MPRRDLHTNITGDASDFNRETKSAADSALVFERALTKQEEKQKSLQRSMKQTAKTAVLTRNELTSLVGAAVALAPAVIAAGAAFGAFAGAAAPSIIEVVKAQENLGEHWNQLNADQRQAALSLSELIGQYKDLSASIEPQALAVFNSGVETSSQLLMQLTPLVEESAGAFIQLAERAQIEFGGDQWTSFFNFLATSARPSVEALGEAFFAIAAVAREATESLMPMSVGLLRAVAAVADLAANLIEAHPLLAQLAVAAVALRAPIGILGNLFTGFGRSLDRNVGRIRAFNTGMAATGPTVTRAGRAFRGVGAFLGGPWGIALGAATVALALFASKQAEATARSAEFRAAIQQDSGVLGQHTRATVASTLAQEGALKQAKQLGVERGLLLRATLGEKDATQQLTGQLEALIARQGSELSMGEGIVTNKTAQAQVARELLGVIRGTNEAIAAEVEAFRLEQQAIAAAKAATGGMTTSTRQLAAQFVQGKITADQFRQSLRSLANLSLSAAQAELRFQEAVDAAKQSVKEHGQTLDINTAKGRANKQALLDLATASNDHRQAMEENGASAKVLNGITARQRQRFIDVARSMGSSAGEASNLADKYGLIPGRVSTRVSAPGIAPTIGSVDALAGRLNALPRNVVISLRARVDSSLVKAGFMGGVAEGGILKSYAHGGMENHVAQIAHPRAMARVWAEPETGGEAYIPMSPAKRGRSTAILNQVASDFGFALVRQFQDGGMTAGTSATAPGFPPMTVNLNHIPGFTTVDDVVRGVRHVELAARYHRRR